MSKKMRNFAPAKQHKCDTIRLNRIGRQLVTYGTGQQHGNWLHVLSERALVEPAIRWGKPQYVPISGRAYCGLTAFIPPAMCGSSQRKQTIKTYCRAGQRISSTNAPGPALFIYENYIIWAKNTRI